MATVYKGKNSWRCIARRRGHVTQSGVFATKAEASRAGNLWEVEFDQGLHKAEGNLTIHTVHELFDRYAAQVSVLKPGARFEVVRLGAFCDKAQHPEFAVKVKDLGQDQMRKWRDRRLTEVKPSTVNRELNIISAAFSYAVQEWGLKLTINPVKTIKRPPATPARRRRVSAEEISKLRFGEQRIPREPNRGMTKDYVPWMIEFSVETGLRLGEMTALRWEHVHLDQHWIHIAAVEVGAKKNGLSRDVPLSPRAEEILKMLGRRDPDRVFPVRKGSVDTMWREIRQDLGIDNLHIHDARHEAVSRLAKVFTPLELAKSIGHKNLNTLLVYYNPEPDELVKKLRGQ